MTIQPGKRHLKIIQGATLFEAFTWKDANGVAKDLTGYTARAQARTDYDAASPFMDLTTANSGIVLGGTAGTIQLKMAAAATAGITATDGYWDLELVAPDGTVTRLLQGSVCVSKEVTR